MQFEIETKSGDGILIGNLLERAARQDGEYPLSEFKELRRGTPSVVERFVFGPRGALIGYGQAGWHPADGEMPGHYGLEIVVDPDWRTEGLGGDLLAAVVAGLDGERATLWAHTEYVARIAQASSWEVQRTLIRMEIRLPVACDDEPDTGLAIRTFRPGVDDEAWLRANNLAFHGHPENGCLTQDDLDLRMQQDWFDPNGFFVAWDTTRAVGSCWTKVHEDGVGEIYIIGVVPGWAGEGLGRALICRGLRHLSQDRGLPKAMLYVEAENQRAIDLYARIGFSIAKTIEAYAIPDRTN